VTVRINDEKVVFPPFAGVRWYAEPYSGFGWVPDYWAYRRGKEETVVRIDTSFTVGGDTLTVEVK
jgi:hypothetical protein